MASNTNKGPRSLRMIALVGGLALAVGGGLAVRAYAQQRPGGTPGQDGRAGHFAQMCETLDARQAGMLAYAEVRLGITDAERPAWTKFAGAVKTSSAPIRQVCSQVAGQPEPKTLPERLHRMELVGTAHLERLRQITPAVEELYGALTPQQREIADHLVEGMVHEGHGHGWHHPPMPGSQPPAGERAPD
jgi:hypothetical protein